jgi:tetratricopeptide (TPR) repeat protein
MSSYNDNKNIVPSGNQRQSRSSSRPLSKGFDSVNSRQSIDGKSSQSAQAPTLQKKTKNFLRHGLDKLNRGDYPAALEDFQQALRLNPDFTEAYIAGVSSSTTKETIKARSQIATKYCGLILEMSMLTTIEV